MKNNNLKKVILITLLLLANTYKNYSQIGIGTTTPAESALLELSSTDKALLLPRVANTAAITNPVNGMMIYDLSSDCFKSYQGGNWSDCGFVKANSPTSNGTGVVSSYSCNTASTGTMNVGTIFSGVTQTITATVTTIGNYNISATANGVTFAATGTFTSTGVQDVILSATGTPAAVGTNSFLLNTTPNCSFSRATDENIAPLPENIILSAVSPYFIASIYDQDYLPYTLPTIAAELPSGPSSETADGVVEATTINIQGKLTTAGVTIKIPYTVVNASVNLPAYSQIISIPSAYTEDGIGREIQFSYVAAILPVGTSNIEARIQTLEGTLNIKKLDLQTGLGNDNLGILLAQFAYAIDNNNGLSSFEVRAITGIPDRNISDVNHMMFYLPIIGIDGNTWLNNNLGADYSNTAKPVFNPGQQATSHDDWKAYGSLFQWGRFSDGHELMNWTDSTTGTVVNGTTTLLASTDTPGHSLFIANENHPADWRSSLNNNLWQGVNGINNPCPVGYRLPTHLEWLQNFSGPNGITSVGYSASNSIFKFSFTGFRHYIDGSLNSTGQVSSYWSSSFTNELIHNRYFANGNAHQVTNDRAFGLPVRCRKD